MNTDDQKINKRNLGVLLNEFIKANELDVRALARSIGCSQKTLERIVNVETYPTERMLKQCGLLIYMGFDEYKKLSKAQREKITEKFGVVSGGGIGFASIGAVISTLGIPGLAASGITSGLASLGSIVYGGMVAGVSVAAAIPVAGALAGYGLIKTIKKSTENYKLNKKDIDLVWEEILSD